jgi:S1-C subfamily serine protease
MRLIRAATIMLAFCSTPTPAPAQGWPVREINHAIEQTNFIVNGGCSGTLISIREKLILTNYHCIEREVSSIEREVMDERGFVRKVKVRKYNDVPVVQNRYDGFIRTGSASYVTEIVAEAKTRDLALLKIKGEIPHTYASPLLPDGEKVVRGERVYTVGNPAGEDASLVEGIVSNVNRTFEFAWTDGAKLPMIQFSGGLFGGNSGGALYDSRGRLIGVPAAGYPSATFIGFAIPVEVVKLFLQDNCLASVFEDTADDKKCRAEKDARKKKD